MFNALLTHVKHAAKMIPEGTEYTHPLQSNYLQARKLLAQYGELHPRYQLHTTKVIARDIYPVFADAIELVVNVLGIKKKDQKTVKSAMSKIISEYLEANGCRRDSINPITHNAYAYVVADYEPLLTPEVCMELRMSLFRKYIISK